MRGSRKIFRVETKEINTKTGEITSFNSTTTYINRNPESFGMYRSTDGLEWAMDLKSHLLFMLVMNEYSDPKTGIVSLSPVKRKEICDFFNWRNTKSLSNTIQKTIEAGGICRIGKSNYDFLVNPSCFYKGSTKDFKERYDRYEKYKQTNK